jgi:hypothetical protein
MIRLFQLRWDLGGEENGWPMGAFPSKRAFGEIPSSWGRLETEKCGEPKRRAGETEERAAYRKNGMRRAYDFFILLPVA